jgi:Domain of unknown function (DUF4399)
VRPSRVATTVAALALLAAGCGRDGGDDSLVAPATTTIPAETSTSAVTAAVPPTVLAIVAPATGAQVGGNVVRLDVAGSGITIVPADGDTSGRTGHYHVFVDRDVVEAGAVVPVAAGIIHTTDDPIVIPGLSVGPHRITVVYGDGTHRRIGRTEAGTSFTVAGPSVDATTPPNATSGQPVTITIAAEGLAEGTAFYVLVDRDPPPAGQTVPDEPGVIQSTETTVAVPDLTPGAHTVWVVAGSAADRVPLDPPVMDRLAVTVG